MLSVIYNELVLSKILIFASLLTGGLASGYIARTKFGVSEKWAKHFASIVLIVFEWSVALLALWRAPLCTNLIYVPVIAVLLLLITTVFSYALFSLHNLNRMDLTTMTLAGGLSNLGSTGTAFLCFLLFGALGMSISQIYLALWYIVVYLLYFPCVKLFASSDCKNISPGKFIRELIDPKLLVIPGVFIGITLNLMGIKQPAFLDNFYVLDILIYSGSILAFISIGLRVSFSRLAKHMSLYFSIGAVKFLVTPALALLILLLIARMGIKLDKVVVDIIIIQSCAPVGVAMVNLSNAFNLNGRLGSDIWFVNTSCFVFIITPILYFIFV